jgi:S-adenosylmethionine synthetase
MIEKVNPSHPDKVADRIANAVIDYCYSKQENPKCAIEVLIGHGLCTIIAETSVELTEEIVLPIVNRIAGTGIELKLISVPQDEHLAENQSVEMRCGDNGIFLGMPMTDEEKKLNELVHYLYSKYPTDGKFILDIDNNKLIICQSYLSEDEITNIKDYLKENNYPEPVINPLGYWTGGTDVDSGATNRKLGSDMGHSVTGGGLHGKDLSKADVCVNIYAWLEAQRTNKKVEMSCAIGDTEINGIPYSEIVKVAREYIERVGGFEAFAEWGLW